MPTKTFTTSTKPVRTKSFTTSTLFVQDLGEYRGAGYTADRDALVGKKALDTFHNIETGEHQYYTGSAWVTSGAKIISENAGVERRVIAPTAGSLRVEIGDSTYPIRYWDGSNTYFFMNSSGDLGIKKLVAPAVGGSLEIDTRVVVTTNGSIEGGAVSQSRWKLDNTNFDRIQFVPMDSLGGSAGYVRIDASGSLATLRIAAPGISGRTSIVEINNSKFWAGGEVEIDGDLNHDGTNVGFYGVTPVSRAAITALVDSTGGSVNRNLAAVSGSGADVAINNNFADCAASINDILTALESLGLVS